MVHLITDKELVAAVKKMTWCGFFTRVEVRNEYYRVFSEKDVGRMIDLVPPVRARSKEYSCKYQAGMFIELLHEIEPNIAAAYVKGLNKQLGTRHAWPVLFVDDEEKPDALTAFCITFKKWPGASDKRELGIVDKTGSYWHLYNKIETVRF